MHNYDEFYLQMKCVWSQVLFSLPEQCYYVVQNFHRKNILCSVFDVFQLDSQDKICGIFRGT